MNDATVLPARHKPDVRAFHALADAGILRREDRVELIDGDIIDTAPVGADHGGAVLRPRDDFHTSAIPGPGDVRLLVEVARSSRHFDRTVTLPLYAQAGIPELWIPDLVRHVVTVHRRPAANTYDEVDTKPLSGRLPMALAPETVITLDGAPGA